MGDHSYIKALFQDKCTVHCTRNTTNLQNHVRNFDVNYMLQLRDTQYLVVMQQMTARVPHSHLFGSESELMLSSVSPNSHGCMQMHSY